MSAPWDLLPDLAARVTAKVLEAAPELVTCKARAGALLAADLKDLGLRSPAVVVSWLEVRPGRERAGPAPSFDLGMAAYVIAKDDLGQGREAVAAAIAMRLLALVPGRTWGRREAGEATNVRLQSLAADATRKAGIALWAVTWTQPFTLALEEIEGELPRELYVRAALPDGDEDDFGALDDLAQRTVMEDGQVVREDGRAVIQ